METLEEHFVALGLSRNASRVYRAALELGEANARAIGHRAALRRTTVYSLLDSLVEKGLLGRTSRRGKALFIANPPTSVLRMINQQQEELSKKELSARRLIDMMQPFFSIARSSQPEIITVEGKKNVESLLYDYNEEWQKNIMQYEQIVWGYQDSSYFREYQSYAEHYWKVRAKYQRRYRILLFSDKANWEADLGRKHQVAEREFRSLPLGVEITSTLWVGGEYIIMISCRESPHFAVQIRNRWMATNLITVFRLLWHYSDPKRG